MDIGNLLKHWPKDEKSVTARIIKGIDGQRLIQSRIDCGILQMYPDGRPDGTKPHDCQSYLEYLERKALHGDSFEEVDEMFEDIWSELDREMMQFYHRRIALLAIARDAQKENNSELAEKCFEKVLRDSDYTLCAMEFIQENCEDEDYADSHERAKPFVIWHKTVAISQKCVLDKNFDDAIEYIKKGKKQIGRVYKDQGLGKWAKFDPSIEELKQLERHIRGNHGIKTTLKEQLDEAISKEDYEGAINIREKLKSKGHFNLPVLRPR